MSRPEAAKYMQRNLIILVLGMLLFDGWQEAAASQAPWRMGVRLNNQQARRGFALLPCARGVPIIPVQQWAPTNNPALLSTNRAVLPETLRVLFLGNALTAGHNMPEVLTRMSRTGKLKIKATMRAPYGFTLENHMADISSRTNISFTIQDPLTFTNRLTWHAVILQEHSLVPVYGWQRLLNSVQRLDGAAQTARTQTALFMPQSRADSIFSEAEFLDRSEGAYRLAAQRNGNLPVIPGGRAWQMVEMRGDNSIQLRARDGQLPTAHGAYLNACVMYAFLTWQTPLGLSNGGLHQINERDAEYLQRIAWELFVSRRAGVPF